MGAEKVIFKNSKGQSIELTNRSPFLLESVEGRGGVDANAQMQTAPYQDGATFIDTTLATRTLVLNINLLAKSRDELNNLRNQISSVFNPKLGLGKLTYLNGNVEREIEVVVDGSPAFPVGDAKGKWFQRTAINLIAPDPYWQGTETENYKLEDFVGNFRFPFHFPVRFATRGDGRTLENNGDVPTPLLIEFRGPAERPKITNYRTGEYIRVNTTIPADHKLILNTEFGNKRVEIVKPNGTIENAFHYIDPYSTFFELDVGETRIGFEAAGGTPEVYVQYRERFVSV